MPAKNASRFLIPGRKSVTLVVITFSISRFVLTSSNPLYKSLVTGFFIRSVQAITIYGFASRN